MLRIELEPPAVDQTIRLVTDPPGAASFWETWGPSLITGGVSLLVALIALGGVLLSASKSRTAMIEAENLRAEKALAAEGVRHANAIAAENLRAAKAIAAEDRRHENTLRQEEIAWTREVKAKAYFGLVEAMARLMEENSNLRWFSRPDPDWTGRTHRQANPAGADAAIVAWNSAFTAAGHRVAEIDAFANAEIAEKARRLITISSEVNFAVLSARKAHPQNPYDYEEVAKVERAKINEQFPEILAAIRAELGTATT